MDFTDMKTAVAVQWGRMSSFPLFRTTVDKDLMWNTYLGSFPQGTNPIFRKRTEHDCSCCRQFVRAIGDVVAIVDGEVTSIWDITTANETYQVVANTLAELVKGRPIDNVFLHTEGAAGTDFNHQETIAGILRWDHFHVRLTNSRVCGKTDIGPRLSKARAAHDVLLRSLSEIKADEVKTVLGLIDANALYRGEEHKHALTVFHETKTNYDRLGAMAFADFLPKARDIFVWSHIDILPDSVSRIRNTSIGTLLTDLSEGMDLEAAVRRFEAMVAPANYKRPTALVTPAMVAKARATVEELGLTTALERRYATLTDITVNNVLFADRTARKAMGGSVFDDLAANTRVKPQAFDKVEEVPIDTFLADILPRVSTIDLLVENRHAGNLVSLIAPADPSSALLFRWPNRFSWSYAGDFADSVRERVKRAGGNVTGDLCCRLAWFNRDDLDFHMQEKSGDHIYYAKRTSRLGGMLDVDMNIRGETREPVENIFYGTERTMREGEYRLSVHSFAHRETTDVGFEVEIDWKGTVHRFVYDRAVRPDQYVEVAVLRYTKANGIEIVSSLPKMTASRKVWGIDTEAFHKARVVMLSPNHWDGHGVGNKHWFFALEGCQNDGTARGFYNEFLRPDLDQHRKVLELVGAKMRTEETANQLSGLGFSSTQHNHVTVRVTGALTRALRVAF